MTGSDFLEPGCRDATPWILFVFSPIICTNLYTTVPVDLFYDEVQITLLSFPEKNLYSSHDKLAAPLHELTDQVYINILSVYIFYNIFLYINVPGVLYYSISTTWIGRKNETVYHL